MNFKAFRLNFNPTITQDEFSLVLGLGLKTWHRYESGKSKPTEALQNYFEILLGHPKILQNLYEKASRN